MNNLHYVAPSVELIEVEIEMGFCGSATAPDYESGDDFEN